MFDIFAKLLSSVASFLFPLFASYKALKTSDPAQLTPWLMYWVVLACALLVESWTDWILVWIPFYAYIRLLFLVYLVSPQTQGARVIYEEYVHPYLEENEAAIEEFIASSHERLRRAGIEYLNHAIEVIRTSVFGLPPSPEPAAASGPQTAGSYTQTLLSKFTLATPKWNTTKPPPAPAPTTGGLTSDFFNLLSSAVSTAASSATAASTSRAAPSASGSSSSSIIPESILSAGTAARVSFIQAQRERLRFVLSALDREEEAATRQHEESAQARGMQHDKRDSLGEASVGSGLSKSRSEGDFEKLDLPSGGEDEGDGAAVRRRGQGQGGSWMGWAWGSGSGPGEEAGKSSGLEK
ncbi:receptor expression-enhancing protein 2 [Dichotomopilus funicola]|uniref:Protein YOP1 n=1 Tax=Dichotomopilus funicola TaxID=1934379 RepID=A0AAN6ZPU3_9PEZI|nr:receptor expression-enhancing protein 2 [Dichotomopilus funicola]